MTYTTSTKVSKEVCHPCFDSFSSLTSAATTTMGKKVMTMQMLVVKKTKAMRVMMMILTEGKEEELWLPLNSWKGYDDVLWTLRWVVCGGWLREVVVSGGGWGWWLGVVVGGGGWGWWLGVVVGGGGWGWWLGVVVGGGWLRKMVGS